jgi:hypothetical protein
VIQGPKGHSGLEQKINDIYDATWGKICYLLAGVAPGEAGRVVEMVTIR